MCVSACVRVYACVRLCVPARARLRAYVHVSVCFTMKRKCQANSKHGMRHSQALCKEDHDNTGRDRERSDPHPIVITNLNTVNESSSGGKLYNGGSIRQDECPSGTKLTTPEYNFSLLPYTS